MISTDTSITLGITFTLLGAAFSFGVMWSKIQTLGRQMVRVEQKVDEILENHHRKNK